MNSEYQEWLEIFVMFSIRLLFLVIPILLIVILLKVLLPSKNIAMKVFFSPKSMAKLQNFLKNKKITTLCVGLLIGIVSILAKGSPQVIFFLGMFLACVFIALGVIVFVKLFLWPINIAKAKNLPSEKMIVIHVLTWCGVTALWFSYLILAFVRDFEAFFEYFFSDILATLDILTFFHALSDPHIMSAAALLLFSGSWFAALCLSIFYKIDPQN